MNPMYPCLRLAWGAALACGVAAAMAPPAAPALPLRSLAATCSACHGTDGRAVSGAGMTGLRGLDKAYIVTQLNAFRDGTRPATVMHQIARGYTPGQIEQLAAYFAAAQ
jgi:cytochrome c553